MNTRASNCEFAVIAREIRHQVHAHPEVLFDVAETSALVEAKLREYGCDEVVCKVGESGVVGIIRSSKPGRCIALRAELDALPIQEENTHTYRSQTAGQMHACGHDGHMAMLLGAVAYLARARDFSGTIVAVFQPAEEGGGGARRMIADGMLDRFGVDEIYAIHNLPGLAVGNFATREGPLLAASDRFIVTIKGRGGHAAMPHLCVDPISAAIRTIADLNTLVAREVDPLDSAVVSITRIQAGNALNVIPNAALFGGTIRTLKDSTRLFLEGRLRSIVESNASGSGCAVELEFFKGASATNNHPIQTTAAAEAASLVAGVGSVERACLPIMGAEDFSDFLAHRPGAFIWLGNGPSKPLHHPEYDFCDEAIPFGIGYWVELVRQRNKEYPA